MMFTKPIEIKNKFIGKGFPTFLIAEMACAHQGDVKQAIELVRIAKKSKMNAIQLQVLKKDLYISPRHKSYDIVSKIELSFDDWQKVVDEIKKLNMIFFGAGYDMKSVEFLLENNVDAFKIHSSDISNIELIKKIGESKKLIFLSCGASNISEIKKTISILHSYGTKEIVLMHGFQAYPTKIRDTHLAFIERLGEVFDLNVGFYDHVDGDSILATIIPIMSIGYGAQVVEKHFILNREKKGIDYESSLNPNELKDFVKLVRESEKAIGLKGKNFFTSDEYLYRKNVKKSLVYIKDLKKDEIIKKDNIIALRSHSLEITPDKYNDIIGKTLTKNVKKYDNVQWVDFE